MNADASALAAEVIAACSREAPADRVLRETLKSQRGLARAIAADVSRAVFRYFRWFGWLDTRRPLVDQLTQAEQLDTRFLSAPSTFPDAEVVSRAVPEWVWTEVERNPAWARALQRQPVLWLRARPGEAQKVMDELGDCRQAWPTELPESLEYTSTTDLFRTPAFHQGLFEIQDLSSQVVGLICGAGPGEKWWDACAGEGGKTLHLSMLMQNKGLIWASDRAEWRLRKLARRAARAGVHNYRSAAWDGSPRLPTKTLFDGVLVDAPCSGIGTWQRNPHARWITTPEDVRQLSALQKQLLGNAASAVKRGGKLVYAVCTVARQETLDLAAYFKESHSEFKPVPVRNPLLRDAPQTEHLWLWPQECRANGMFVALWEKL